MSKRYTPSQSAARKRAQFSHSRSTFVQRRGKAHGLTSAQKREERVYALEWADDPRQAYLSI